MMDVAASYLDGSLMDFEYFKHPASANGDFFLLDRPWSGLLVRCVMVFDMVLGLISTQSI